MKFKKRFNAKNDSRKKLGTAGKKRGVLTKNRSFATSKRKLDKTDYHLKNQKVDFAKNKEVPKRDQLKKKFDFVNKKEEPKRDQLKKKFDFANKNEEPKRDAKFIKPFRKRTRDSYEIEEESNDSSGDEPEGNAGWADSIAKVLNSNKPKTKKVLVLSRAKKGNPAEKQEKKPRTYDFEVDGEASESETESTQPIKKKREKLKERIKMMELHLKPSPTDYDEERDLRKVATRAVVQFFNAVNIQQKKLEVEIKKAGPLDHRKDAVYSNIDKRKFLDILKRTKPISENSRLVKEIKDETSINDSKPSGWSVLRPDYMTNKKSKHWDKGDSDSSNESLNSDEDNIGTDDDLE